MLCSTLTPLAPQDGHSLVVMLVDMCTCTFQFSPQKGDSAVIRATVGHESGALRELVRAGADLNLQNEVRYTVTVDTALHHVSSPAVHIRRV